MEKAINITRAVITGMLTIIHLLWQWALNTTLITMVAGFVVFLATQNIQQFDLAFYQELFREYALLASIGVAVIFVLNRAVSFVFGGRISSVMERHSRKAPESYDMAVARQSEH